MDRAPCRWTQGMRSMEASHVGAVESIEQSLLAAADEIVTVGNEERARGTEIEIGLVEPEPAVRREEVGDRKGHDRCARERRHGAWRNEPNETVRDRLEIRI